MRSRRKPNQLQKSKNSTLSKHQLNFNYMEGGNYFDEAQHRKAQIMNATVNTPNTKISSASNAALKKYQKMAATQSSQTKTLKQNFLDA